MPQISALVEVVASFSDTTCASRCLRALLIKLKNHFKTADNSEVESGVLHTNIFSSPEVRSSLLESINSFLLRVSLFSLFSDEQLPVSVNRSSFNSRLPRTRSFSFSQLAPENRTPTPSFMRFMEADAVLPARTGSSLNDVNELVGDALHLSCFFGRLPAFLCLLNFSVNHLKAAASRRANYNEISKKVLKIETASLATFPATFVLFRFN